MENQRQAIKILHVDDDEDIRAIAEISLGLATWAKAFHCSSGQEALKMVNEVSPDVLLLDYLMPGMTGVETWRAIQKIHPFEKIPTIFMTAKAERAFGSELINSGAIGIITKPFDPTTLADEILELIKGDNFSSSDILN